MIKSTLAGRLLDGRIVLLIQGWSTTWRGLFWGSPTSPGVRLVGLTFLPGQDGKKPKAAGRQLGQ